MTPRLTPRQILETLVAFPTVSRDPNLPLIEWVSDYLASHGVASQMSIKPDDPGKAGLWAHVGPWEDGGIVLSGHTDVVPVDGQDWSTDPFSIVEQDGKLFGRGATDMKGFDALAIWAMVEAHHAGLSRPLQLALTYDEEIGCSGAAEVIAALSPTVPRARDVIVGEPTRMKAVTGHKGGVTWWVHVHGFEIHSSMMHRGVSAIMYAAKLIDWANDLNDRLMAADPGPVAALFDPSFTTAHVGQIQGGTAHNITARDCEFQFGFRVVPGEDVDRWRRIFRDEVAKIEAEMQAVRPETSIECSESFHLPPFLPEAGGTAESLIRSLTGDNSENMVSYGTEASHFQAAGYSAVVCGPGDIAMAHQPDEYITVEQFEAGKAFMERLLDTIRA